MGSACSCFQDPKDVTNLSADVNADTHANNQIDKYMKTDKKNDESIQKLLLLGTGSAGKSTLFQQIECLYGNGFDPYYVEMNTIYVRENCVTSMVKLVQQTDNLRAEYKECAIDLDNKETINAIQLLGTQLHENDDDNAHDDNKNDEKRELLGYAIEHLWSLNSIRKTYTLRQYFSLLDNMDYFFNKVTVIFSPNYIPSAEDFIKTKVMTIGVLEKKYVINNVPFHIFDVGGQRNERKKWIQLFDGVHGLIFVAALSDYASRLFEDERVNGMQESLELFDEISNSKWFIDTQIIIFLNKDDIFQSRLKAGIPLSVCFGDKYKGSSYLDKHDDIKDDTEWFKKCHKQSLMFIKNEYNQKQKIDIANPQKHLYFHITNATSQNNVNKVFTDVRQSMLKQNLQDSGLLK